MVAAHQRFDGPAVQLRRSPLGENRRTRGDPDSKP